jgi:penicillin G amidase
MIWLRRILALLLLLVSLTTLGLYYFAHRQGQLATDYTQLTNTKIDWDALKVPTIEAPNWDLLIEAQGFVVASERIFQMDLMRRSASGRLSEWFGSHPSAIAWDRGRREEDWLGVAKRAAEALPASEKNVCEAYTRGVNRFIDSMQWRWGMEYIVLTHAPEKWQCADTILILMSLVDDLTRTSDREEWMSVWKKNVPADWFSFLFPQDHPWNKPLFGAPAHRLVAPKTKLAPRPLNDELLADSVAADSYFPGSNSWFWAGKTGAFLAGDPHLGMTVPQIWYANRLRISSKEWVAGVSAPGIPGVILGRNAFLSWAFTNVGEDVDDLLEEEISADGKSYVHSVVGGKKVFKPIREQPYTIEVRGGDPVQGIAKFTHRGPLLERSALGKDRMVSRQWLGFFTSRLRLPILEVNQARSWEEMNKALDKSLSPAQSVLVADNRGNVGYRMSGSGVRRKIEALTAVPAIEGEWQGFYPPSERKRLWIKRQPGKVSSIATANQRIFVDTFGHHWSSDTRQRRITEFLAKSDAHDQKAMHDLQLDTYSRYLQGFTQWIVRNNLSQDVAIERVLAEWKDWDGFAKTRPVAFYLALEAHRIYTRALMGQVRKSLLPADLQKSKLIWKDQNAWLVYLLENEKALESFGFDKRALAHFIIKKTAGLPASSGYAQTNSWRAQHPMAGAVPLLGTWLKVDESPQIGFEGLVRIEREHSGASMRAVWNIDEPLKSAWVFPVGQSGHVASKHYKDFRKLWFAEKTANVFPEKIQWDFLAP